MNKDDISRYQDLLIATATEVGLKVLAAVAFWVIGRWLIGVAVSMVRASLERQKVDPTVLRYVGSIVTVTLNVLLVVGILGYFGIQTTSFAAMLAGAAANTTGIALMCLIVYRISIPVLVLSMAVGAMSGCVGGVLACAIHRRVARIDRQTHGG